MSPYHKIELEDFTVLESHDCNQQFERYKDGSLRIQLAEGKRKWMECTLTPEDVSCLVDFLRGWRARQKEKK